MKASIICLLLILSTISADACRVSTCGYDRFGNWVCWCR